MLKEMEAERRLQEITENNTVMFKEELYKIQGEHDMHNMQQQQVTNDLLIQIQTPCSIFSDKTPKPCFQILYWINICVLLGCPNNQGKHHLQPMTRNHHMNQKDLLEDLVMNMGFQLKHEKVLYGGKLNHPNSLEHSYQTGDGDHLILNIIHKKGHLQND